MADLEGSKAPAFLVLRRSCAGGHPGRNRGSDGVCFPVTGRPGPASNHRKPVARCGNGVVPFELETNGMSLRALVMVGVVTLGGLSACSKKPEPPVPAPTNQSPHAGGHAAA